MIKPLRFSHGRQTKQCHVLFSFPDRQFAAQVKVLEVFFIPKTKHNAKDKYQYPRCNDLYHLRGRHQQNSGILPRLREMNETAGQGEKMTFSPELNRLFSRWLLYDHLAEYWQRGYQEYVKHPHKEHLKNCHQAATEAAEKAAGYWQEFVAGVVDCGAAVSYRPNVGVMVENN